jgi:hypothetical protein
MTKVLSVMPHVGHKWMAHCDIGEHDRSDIMFPWDVWQ